MLRHLLLVGSALAAVACTDPLRMTADERFAIANALSTRISAAYDFTNPQAAERLLSLYPDSGRVISAAAGRVTTTRDTLAGSIRGFWARVGRNMQEPRFVIGSTWVDVLTRDAAVMTITYAIPHRTPQGTSHVVSGAWTMLWRRVNGEWFIIQEHLSDTPESTAPGPTPTDTAAGATPRRDTTHSHH